MRDAERMVGVVAKAAPSARVRFAETYAREWRFVLNLVRRLGVPADSAEDAAQEVFLVFLARLSRLDDKASLRSWLRAVARRVCSNQRRALSRRRCSLGTGGAIDDVPDDVREPPDAAVLTGELRRRIASAIERLPPKKRDVLILAIIDRRTTAEIAKMTQTPANIVSSRLREARLQCAHYLRTRGDR